MLENRNSRGNFWLGFFLGGLLGALIIYLLGTQEGKKLLEKIIQNAENYEKELEKKVTSLQQKGEDFLKEAEEVKEKVITHLHGDEKKLSEQLMTKIDKALTKLEDLQKRGSTLTSEMHHRYFKRNGKRLIS